MVFLGSKNFRFPGCSVLDSRTGATHLSLCKIPLRVTDRAGTPKGIDSLVVDVFQPDFVGELLYVLIPSDDSIISLEESDALDRDGFQYLEDSFRFCISPVGESRNSFVLVYKTKDNYAQAQEALKGNPLSR